MENKTNNIISIELLSEVLSKKVLSFNIKNNEIFIQFDNYDDILNIHELAHKGKEWAMLINGYSGEPYIIESSYEHFANKNKIYAIVRVYKDGDMVWNNYGGEFIGEWHTEPEAVFKACQWIYGKEINNGK